MSRRILLVSLDVGDADPASCGQCPFRALDWEGGEPRGREFCTCPAWESAPDITGGVRHDACLDAEPTSDELERISWAP